MLRLHKISQIVSAALLSSCLLNFGCGATTAQESALSRPLVPIWRFETPRLTNLSPATSAGRIYTTLDSGEIIALAEASGMRVWQTELGGEVSISPVAEEKAIYVATRRFINAGDKSVSPTGSLRCLSTTGGLTQWVRDLPVALTGNFGINNMRLFAIDARGVLFSFDKATGAVQWSIQHSSEFTTNIIADDARLYVGSNDGTIYALDQATGRTLWKQKISARLSTIGRNMQRIFGGSSGGRVYAFDSVTGSPLWRKNFGGTIKFIAPAKDGIVIASLNNSVYYVESERGNRLWKRQLAERIATAPLVSGDAILIAPLSGGACIVVSRSNGRVINTIQLEGGVNATAHPVLAENTLVLTTNGGVIGYSAAGAFLSRTIFH